MELSLILSILVFSLLISGICFLMGFGFGWFGREYYENAIASKRPVLGHPEMFDENGNLIPDELIAVRFENFEEDEEDEEED